METNHFTINTTNNLDENHPWPGLKTFSEDNENYFFGRSKETQDIARLVRHETLTVLIGKSGLGKSSILQAGVAPNLRQSGFIPVYIRLNHHEESLPLEDQVEVFFEKIIADNNIDAPQPIREETLWEYFHKQESDWWNQDNELLKPVLIFDQFEEIITAGQENPIRAQRCINFLTELEDLIENRPPKKLMERFKEEKGLAKNYDLNRQDYRILLSLREDYLADLESLREKLRPILRNRYRLMPMNRDQAIEVILKPGGHLVDLDTANEIVNFVSTSHNIRILSTGNDEDTQLVEPALLSVILRELNNHRIDKKQDKISSELVRENRPDQILANFYESAVNGFNKHVKEFIEDQLLTATGARNRIAEEDAISRFGLTEDIITELINRRIIQRERTATTTWLELTHDTLTNVVKNSAAKRKRQSRVWRIAQITAASVIILFGLGISGYYYLLHQRELQTTEAADLALSVAKDLHTDNTADIAEKRKILDKLNFSFLGLKNIAKGSQSFDLKYANFLSVYANILFDHGYLQEAINKAINADTLIINNSNTQPFSLSNNENLNSDIILLKIEQKLSAAYAYVTNKDHEKFTKTIEQSQLLLNQFKKTNERITEQEKTLQLRINILKLENLYEQDNYDDFFSLSEKTYEIINQIHSSNRLKKSENISKDELLRVYNYIYSFFLLQINLKNIGMLNSDKLVNESELVFDNIDQHINNDSKHYQYLKSQYLLIKSYNNRSEDKIIESRLLLDQAIEIARTLATTYPKNLKYRRSLLHHLKDRSQLLKTYDKEQARLDLEATDKISYTLKLDSYNILHSRDSVLSVFENIKLDPKNKDFNILFKRFNSKLNTHEKLFSDERWALELKTIMLYYQMDNIKQPPNKKSDIESNVSETFWSYYNEAINNLNKLSKQPNVPNYFISERENYFHVLAYNSSFIAKDEKIIYLNKIISNFEKINNNTKHYNNTVGYTYWLSQLGRYHENNKNHMMALDAYNKAIEFSLPRIKTNHNTYLISNTLISFNDYLEILLNKGNYEQAINFTNKLNNIIIEINKIQNMDSIYATKTGSNIKLTIELLTQLLKDSNTNHESLETIIAVLNNSHNHIATFTKNNSNNKPLPDYSRPDYQKLELDELISDNKTNRHSSKRPLAMNQIPYYDSIESYNIDSKNFKKYTKLFNPNMHITHIRVTPLKFYQDADFVTIEMFDHHTETYKYQHGIYDNHNDESYELNGTSPPIHSANKQIGIKLDTLEKTYSYVRFFMKFVQGEYGHFQVVESIDQLNWASGTNLYPKKAIKNIIRPLTIWRSDKNPDEWHATATVNYSDAIFYAKLTIQATGEMAMDEDLPIAINLPLDSFIIAKPENHRNTDYIHRTYLPIIEDIIIDDLDDEITLLKKSYKEGKYKNHTLLSEITHLTKNASDDNFKTFKKLAAYLEELKSFIPNSVLIKHNLEANESINNAIDNYSITIEKMLEDKSQNTELLASNYLGLAFYQLFARNFDDSLTSSKLGLEANSNYLPLYTNYAHALMFLGKGNEALELYKKYIGQEMQDSVWEKIILDDFEQLENVGITHPLMSTVRESFQNLETGLKEAS